jgi:hypothetical protein
MVQIWYKNGRKYYGRCSNERGIVLDYLYINNTVYKATRNEDGKIGHIYINSSGASNGILYSVLFIGRDGKWHINHHSRDSIEILLYEDGRYDEAIKRFGVESHYD